MKGNDCVKACSKGALCRSVGDDDERENVLIVPCSTPALITAIIAANSSPATLELAPRCTYSLTTLAQVTLSGHTTNTASGGALNNTGRAVVIRTLISGNIADGVSSGGGISNSSLLTID